MGREIITDFKNNFKLLSTISDGILAEFKTEKELLKFMAMEKIYQGKLRAIELLIRGLDQCCINGECFFSETRQEDIKIYHKWLMSIQCYATYDEYWKAIDRKLEELGIKI